MLSGVRTAQSDTASGGSSGLRGNPWLHWSYFGLWALYVWRLWVSNNNSNLPEGFVWQGLFGVMSAVFMVAVGFGLGTGRIGKAAISVGPLSAWVSGCCMTAAAVFVVIANADAANTLFGGIAMVVGGVGIAIAYLQWGVFFSHIDSKWAVLYLFGSGIVASVAKMALFFLPPMVGAAAMAVLPLVSSWCIRRSLLHRPPHEPVRIRYGVKNYASLWKVAIVVVTFSLTNAVLLALLKGPAETSSPMIFFVGRFIEVVFSAVVLFWVFRRNGSFDFVQLWRFILLALGTVLLMNVLVGDFYYEDALISASFNFITLFVWLTCADIARHSDLNPVIVFGCGWLAYAAPLFGGAVLAPALALDQFGDFKIAFVLMYAMSIVVAVCLGNRDSDMRYIFSDLNASSTPPEDFASIDERCEALASQYGISPRELEIMQMICKGRSKAYIAETLFIAESTVKGHSKHLYAKLGVHSKRELQELVGA